MACIEKLNVMNSQTGLRPAIAAPTAIPVKPISVIGVSITRLSPYFFHSPRETLQVDKNLTIIFYGLIINTHTFVINASRDNRK
jgi:hypothetical protein